MVDKNPINVFSEIGKLKKVLLHRPGEELNNLAPEYLSRLLFDDTPFLEIAQKEHDTFAKTLTKLGAEVVYVEDLVVESLQNTTVKEEFIKKFIKESDIVSIHKADALINYFLSLSTKDMVNKMIAGVFKEDIKHYKQQSLSSLVDYAYPFLCDPLPNLLFQRDPFSTIGHGISLHHMHTPTRRRETIFAEYIFKYHKDYANNNTPLYYNRDLDNSIEGGDILVLSEDTLIVGISERTDPAAVDTLARNIFAKNSSFTTIIGLKIPSSRAFMHLDTVFTHIDHTTFTIHPEVEDPLNIYRLTKDNNNDYGVKIVPEKITLVEILKECVGKDITLIRCAGGNLFHAAKEQWNDGTNTLAVAPGEVIVYDRNVLTNKILQEHGIKTHVIPSSELSRGRGGPRCMSMPLVREKLKK
ncbi:Arginine deiminase [Candidatus Hepatincola sp. Pdp]